MKPSTVTTAQVILWIQGLLTLVLSVVMFSLAGQTDLDTRSVLLIFVALSLLQAALEIAAAIGLAGGHNWARIMAITVETIAVIVAGLNLLSSAGATGGGYMCGAVVGIGLAITVIVCLAQENAREWCRPD